MGVEYYPCAVCNEAICDAGDYYRCAECNDWYCSEGCLKEHNVIYQRCNHCQTDEEAEEHGCSEEMVCGFCRGEMVTNSDLLTFTLEILNVSREELVKKYLERGSEV